MGTSLRPRRGIPPSRYLIAIISLPPGPGTARPYDQMLTYGGTMTRVRQASLAVLLATLLATTMLTVAGTAAAFAQPAGHSLNLHHVKWGNVAIPGKLCRVRGPIQLHNGHA